MLEISPDAALVVALLSEGSASFQITGSPDPEGDAAALRRAAQSVLGEGQWQVDSSDPAGAFVWISLVGLNDKLRQVVFERLVRSLASRTGTLVVHDGVPPFLRAAFCSETGLPAGWPSDVPLPPGARLLAAVQHGGRVEVELDQDVAAFYRGALLAAGFSLDSAGYRRGALTVTVTGRSVAVTRA